MVATEVSALLDNIRGIGQTGVFDFADKLNAVISVSVIITCSLVVTVKQYFQEPLSCYTATEVGGSSVGDFVNNYCWVEGTVRLPVDQALPTDEAAWKKVYEDRIRYYQWVPFVLALQAILFILPRFLWQLLTYNRTGTDLERLIQVAAEGASDEADDQEKKIAHVTSTIKNVIFASREVRKGAVANMRRQCFRVFGCLTPSKRMGSWIVAVYFIIKIAYLANVVGQIYLMQRFLGLHKKYSGYFGLELARDIVSGRDWRQTFVFPRVTFCRVGFQHVGSINYQTSQCVLGVNYLNEKIFIFLWFWMMFVALFTLVSIPMWILRLSATGSGTAFIKKHLLLSENFEEKDRKLLKPFIRLYLRHDGVFVLRMVALNAGDFITSRVTARLFNDYKDHLLGQDMFDGRRFAEGPDGDVPLLRLGGPDEVGFSHPRPGKLEASDC